MSCFSIFHDKHMIKRQTHVADVKNKPLYCVYTMFPAAPAAPFARNVACRGVLVIHLSDFQDLLRFVSFSYVVLRNP